MSNITVGTVTIGMPENIELDPRAGKLSNDEVTGIVKSRKGLGLACELTATDMEKSAGEFIVPGVDPQSLRIKGDIADTFDKVIRDLEIALRTIKQGNLLADEAAYNDLRRVNKQVQAQEDFSPDIKERFEAVVEYFKN